MRSAALFALIALIAVVAVVGDARAQGGACTLNGPPPAQPNDASIAVVFDTSASMLDGGRGEQAKKVLKGFVGTTSSRMDLSITTFRDQCDTRVAVPAGPMSSNRRDDVNAAVDAMSFDSATPIVDSVNLASAQLNGSRSSKKMLLLVTDGEPTCRPSESSEICPTLKALAAKGVQVVVIGYLLTAEAARAYQCGTGVNVYYGVDAGTPADEAGARLGRLLGRARRAFLNTLSRRYQESLFRHLGEMMCVEKKIGRRWRLAADAEYRTLDRKVHLNDAERTLELDELHPLQPRGEGQEVGAEDLFRVGDDGERVTYLQAYAEALQACCGESDDADTGASGRREQMDQMEDDFKGMGPARLNRRPPARPTR